MRYSISTWKKNRQPIVSFLVGGLVDSLLKLRISIVKFSTYGLKIVLADVQSAEFVELLNERLKQARLFDFTVCTQIHFWKARSRRKRHMRAWMNESESKIRKLAASITWFEHLVLIDLEGCVFQKSRFLLVVDPPMGFGYDYSSYSNSTYENLQKKSIFRKIDFHWMLANQWDFEVYDKQIRVPHFVPHTADHFPTNSIFIGVGLTNQVSHAIGVRFGFPMLDIRLSVVHGAKIRFSRNIQIWKHSDARCYTYKYFKS